MVSRGSDVVDYLIIGAGASGSLLAAKLAEAGKSVTILEAGPKWSPGDLVSSQIWSRRLRWGGDFVASTGGHPIAFDFNAGWGAGGAALHHYATWPRLKPEDFHVRSRHGRGLDWPIAYEDLQPYYDRIQTEVGISGDAEGERWRPPGLPYPMPPLEVLRQAEVIKRGFASLGMTAAPAPMAINSIDRNGRPACIYDGWCDAGCPIGALANPLATYLRQAVEAGAHLICEADVTRLIPSSRSQVREVEYRHRGRLMRLRARHFILAGSVVGNPAILLNSTSEFYPHGLGNDHDLVGRYVMTHGLVMIVGLYPDLTEPHRGVTGASLICHDGYAKDAVSNAFGSRQWLIGASIKPNDLAGLANADVSLYGPKLDAFMRQAVLHAGNMAGMSEEMPEPDNRVVLQAGDGGRRRPKLNHAFNEDAVKLWTHHRDEGIALFKAGGARMVRASAMNSAHLMGGSIMGVDASDSVTDSYGRVHGIDNLFIAGPGLFPTSGAVNPTFTIHALGLRTAEYLIKQHS